MDIDKVISTYSAEEAERDGFLHNVGDIAREAGFKWPVRITPGVLELVDPSKGEKEFGQSYDGRLWDVLNMAKYAIVETTDDPPLVEFKTIFSDERGKQETVKFWAIIDTTSGPAIHIMLPDEY